MPVAYDSALADRVRELLGALPGIDEKPMCGGLAFLIDGNMAVAVSERVRRLENPMATLGLGDLRY